MESPCNFPLFFIKHHWLVVNNKGIITRWETGYSNTLGLKRWGCLRTDAFPYYEVISVLPMLHGWRWLKKIVKFFSGDKESLAHKMAQLIEGSPEIYPYRDKYGWFGPNSNTYPQWVLDQFPEVDYLLSGSSVGRNYKRG